VPPYIQEKFYSLIVSNSYVSLWGYVKMVVFLLLIPFTVADALLARTLSGEIQALSHSRIIIVFAPYLVFQTLNSIH